MSNSFIPSYDLIHTIVFDFDGVFTDNKVWVDQDGKETVRCDRGDGLALDLLRAFIKAKNWKLDLFILSKEKNKVVTARAKKLRIPCIHGIDNKATFLIKYMKKNKKTFSGLVYIGNDLNDLSPMQLAGYSFAPYDAHPLVRKQASYVFDQRGGDGFVRAFIEKLLKIESISVEDFLSQKLI